MRTGTLLFLTCVLFCLFPSGWGQTQYPKNYFRSPVNETISLSGSFGEIRRNHFHSGIDIRTGGVQGKPIYAVADGYVSRVNVSPSGFGKALYITHPNGFVSVYGHLRSFAGAIASWVRTQQYTLESFALDTEVPQGKLKVKKGELVAYSGNSGASGGPHLHFEIRDARTQETIDPIDFGFMQPDGIPPRIAWIKIYPFDENSMVNFTGNPLLLPVTGSDGLFSLKMMDTVRVSGNIILGIETSDNNGNGSLKTGVHSIYLSVDGIPVYSHILDRFAFSETRYVNSLIDFPAFVQNKRKIQRSYVAPNNKLTIYSNVQNQGIIHFSDRKAHKVQYIVKDGFGNSSRLTFWVKSHPPAPLGGRPPLSKPKGEQLFTCGADNHFSRPGILFDVPKEALYEDLPFEYFTTGQVQGTSSRIHHLHNQYTPLHTYCSLSIKPEGLPEKWLAKAVIVEIEERNRFVSRGGKYENGHVTTRIRDFGNYAIMLDTVPPVIRPVNVFPNKKVSKQSSIQVKISDNLSGIKTYRGTLNGKWILMDYDEKTHLLAYAFDQRMSPGKNSFKLVVTDAVGNTTRYEVTLIR